MPDIGYRQASTLDIPAIAKLRTGGWGTEEFWLPRVAGYMDGTIHPQKALQPRVLFVATNGSKHAGCIAGHLTQRHGCGGELQRIDVAAGYRRLGIAGKLLHLLADWFVEQSALKICVNVDPANAIARSFYNKHGAEDMNDHWLVWNDIRVVLAGG